MAGRGSRVIHAARVHLEQRVHLAALLILLAALPAVAQDDIRFDPAITDQEFATFSRLVAQGIFASPVQPARAAGLLGFDIGIAATAVEIDENSGYWQRAVAEDFSTSGYVAVPRLVVSKGFSIASVSAMYAKIPDTEAKTWGAALDVPLISGGLVRPTVAIRASYAKLSGIEQLALTTYGAELFISKGFGPVTPYGAIGKQRTDSSAETASPPGLPVVPPRQLSHESDMNRYTLGVRLSLFLPKISVEATQAEVRSYSAKISIGL